MAGKLQDLLQPTPEEYSRVEGPQQPNPVPSPAPGPNLAAAAAPKTSWNIIREAIIAATHQGIGGFLDRNRDLFNPFLALTSHTPGATYGTRAYKGIGDMGRRLRLIENEESVPMRSLRAVAEQNPLIQNATVKVGTPGVDLPRNVAGKINWKNPMAPEITIGGVLDRGIDPGLVATHEIVGHGAAGPIGWRAQDREELERRIRPQAEGGATGVERGIYGKLAPRSGYDRIYGKEDSYKRAQAIGDYLGQHIAKTGRVPEWQKVQHAIFGAAPPPSEPQPTATGTPGGQNTQQQQLSSPGSLPAAIVPPPKVTPPFEDMWGSKPSPGDITRKALGLW